MPNLYYRDRLIIAYASLNHSTKQWSAGAEISWKTDGRRRAHTLGGLADRFGSPEEAEAFAVNLARAWIDSNP